MFFGADPRQIAAGQVREHRAKLAGYEALERALEGAKVSGPLLALRAGLGHEREWVRYWAELAGEDGSGQDTGTGGAGR